MEERPVHCHLANQATVNLKQRYAGFSESSLTRERQFSASCPFGSPPTVCCLTPTDLQKSVIQNLQNVMNKLDDDEETRLPNSYQIAELSTRPTPSFLVEVDKMNVHLFDGDGGEVCMVY